MAPESKPSFPQSCNDYVERIYPLLNDGALFIQDPRIFAATFPPSGDLKLTPIDRFPKTTDYKTVDPVRVALAEQLSLDLKTAQAPYRGLQLSADIITGDNIGVWQLVRGVEALARVDYQLTAGLFHPDYPDLTPHEQYLHDWNYRRTDPFTTQTFLMLAVFYPTSFPTAPFRAEVRPLLPWLEIAADAAYLALHFQIYQSLALCDRKAYLKKLLPPDGTLGEYCFARWNDQLSRLNGIYETELTRENFQTVYLAKYQQLDAGIRLLRSFHYPYLPSMWE